MGDKDMQEKLLEKPTSNLRFMALKTWSCELNILVKQDRMDAPKSLREENRWDGKVILEAILIM